MWHQGAQQITAFNFNNNAQDEQVQLRDLVLRGIALLYAYQPHKPVSPNAVYDASKRLYRVHYAHGWYHDTNALGAFPFFRPNQLGHVWLQITHSSVISAVY
jgi:hypothetical protein